MSFRLRSFFFARPSNSGFLHRFAQTGPVVGRLSMLAMFAMSCGQVSGQSASAGSAEAGALAPLNPASPGEAPIAAQESGETAQAAKLSPEEATDLVLSLLDAFERRWGEPPTRQELDRLNSQILAIQAADPSNIRIHFLYGRAYALMGRTGPAIAELQKYLETREGRNEWRAYRSLGDLFIDEFPRMALSNFEKAAALKPDDPIVLVGLSRARYGVGDLPTALDYAKRAVQADRGEHIRPIANLARMFANNQQWADAERTAGAAVEKARQRAMSEAGRGPLAVLLEQYDLLIGVLQSRIAATDGSPAHYATLSAAMRGRAAAAQRMAKYDALSVIEAGLRRFTQPSVELLLEHAVSLAELDRTADAIDAFEKVLANDPQNSAAREWLARLRSSASSESDARAPGDATTTSSRP